jgi:2-polyprenyl-6-methoxyphenol hydroxylase-like FAD-dependent oxidoreductase
MDIVWCKAPPLDSLPGARLYVGRGHLLLAYRAWDGRVQVAWVILKGTFGELHHRGIPAWVDEMAGHVAGDLGEHLRASRDSLEHPVLLSSRADRVSRWSRPGVLLLGDAAHTMSPVGAQGLNIALRDVIAAANHLVPVLRADGSPEAVDAAARRVQAEREPEVRTLQRLQAVPPRLLLQRAFWGEPARRLAARLLTSFVGRRAMGVGSRPFLLGIGAQHLRV